MPGRHIARRASRHIATANAERRGARRKLENEDLARAKPVEAGKPGLSGRLMRWQIVLTFPSDRVVDNDVLAAHEGGFGGRSGNMFYWATSFASKKILHLIMVCTAFFGGLVACGGLIGLFWNNL